MSGEEGLVDVWAGVVAVVLAGGSGSRFGAAGNKAYASLAGQTVLARSLNAFAALGEITRLVLVIREADRVEAVAACRREVGADVELVMGGATRHESEAAALTHLAPAIGAGEVGVVLIHDAARPLVGASLVRSVVAGAARFGAALPALADADLVRVGDDGRITGAPTGDLARVQTPQGFSATALLTAFQAAAREQFAGTDTASCIERFSDTEVRWVPGDPANIKITYPGDLAVAEVLLAEAGGVASDVPLQDGGLGQS